LHKIDQIDKKIYTDLSKTKVNPLLFSLGYVGNFTFVILTLIIIFFLPYTGCIEISLISFVFLLFDTAVVFALKYTIRRKRGSIDDDIFVKIDPYSFPSGHASRLSGLVFTMYPIFPLQIFFLIFTVVVSLIRMMKGYHYLSDCVVGTLIGIVTGIISVIFSNLYIPPLMELAQKILPRI
jgi:membrane-associated phospholipid phosphatase